MGVAAGADSPTNRRKAPGRLLAIIGGRPRLRGASERASEWPPFAFYTAKIHLISRWWTDGRTDGQADVGRKEGREREGGKAPRKACVAATPGRNGPTLPYVAGRGAARARSTRKWEERAQFWAPGTAATATTTTSNSTTRKGICNCGTYFRCNLNCPPPLFAEPFPVFLRENSGQRP